MILLRSQQFKSTRYFEVVAIITDVSLRNHSAHYNTITRIEGEEGSYSKHDIVTWYATAVVIIITYASLRSITCRLYSYLVYR